MRSLSLTEIGSLAHSLKIRHLPDETPWLMNILMLPQGPCSSWPKYLSEKNSLAKGKKLVIFLLVVICYFNLSGHILTYVKQFGAEQCSDLWHLPISCFCGANILTVPISHSQSEVSIEFGREEHNALSVTSIGWLQYITKHKGRKIPTNGKFCP